MAGRTTKGAVADNGAFLPECGGAANRLRQQPGAGPCAAFLPRRRRFRPGDPAAWVGDSD